MGGFGSEGRVVVSEVRDARSVASVRVLLEEYARSIGVDLAFQRFDAELSSLPGAYAPPRGRLMIARVGGNPAGCVALRPRSRTVGEIKRLYVRQGYRARGLGRRLTERLIADAQQIGYRRLVLDTLSTMTAAMELYRSLGFVETPSYYDNPIAGARFFSRSLTLRALSPRRVRKPG